jgi:hypothetical protein
MSIGLSREHEEKRSLVLFFKTEPLACWHGRASLFAGR